MKMKMLTVFLLLVVIATQHGVEGGSRCNDFGEYCSESWECCDRTQCEDGKCVLTFNSQVEEFEELVEGVASKW